nr:butyrophilin subfamily 1 member A1-like [Paramormyrops kingsleyae]
MKDKWSSCSCFILLLFQHASVSRPEKFELLLGPSDPVVVVAGDDVVLPCFLKPSISAVDMEVRWFRKDFTEYVYLYQNAQTITTNQIPSYKERAALFPEELTKGNVSLKLTGVKSSDGGRYKCFVQSTESHDDWSIDVIIMGTKSLISIERYRDRGISFKYELKTWYPDAEVTWLDSEGQNLTAEYSETHRSTDGSLSLRGRVIVQERHRNRFTSRVLQKQLGLLREEVVEIPAQLLEMDAHLLEMDAQLWETDDQLRKTRVQQPPLCCPTAQLLDIQDHLPKILDFEENRKNAVDVTLDPDQPEVIISEDGKEVTCRDNKQNHSSNLQRLDDFCFYDLWLDLNRLGVLGKEGFTSGRHYWEVMVGKKTEWALGVVAVTNGKKFEFSWGIGLSKGSYQTFGKHCINLYVEEKPEKVGIFVDYGEGQVSFYNVGAKSYIYSFFELKFKKEIYPFFIPSFQWDEDNSAPLIITPVHDNE